MKEIDVEVVDERARRYVQRGCGWRFRDKSGSWSYGGVIITEWRIGCCYC